MCGIAGIALRPGVPSLDLEPRLAAMAAAMQHRGPDDGGVYVAPDRRLGFANRRLAIRDCSPAGHMPMLSADGLSCISYNGECYNTESLRAALQAQGVLFRSQSDTEVLLYGQRHWGEDLLSHVRGMFAFALYDRRPQAGPAGQLLLARDRLGIKPLYYALTAEALVFASELKALLASGLVARELDPAALAAYLMLGAIPAPLTIYQQVRALEPGHLLRLDLASPTLPQPQTYWQLPTTPAAPISEAAALEQVQALLTDAVRSHLVSDVPLGAFLSGGLDSSAVVALMRTATNGSIRTCAMAFEEQGFNEAPYARAMAAAVGAEHHERILTGSEVLGSLDQILWAMDQPSLDGVNTYFVAQTARQAGLTVALSGLGGDELFGGYPNTFAGVPRTQRALSLVQSLPGAAALAEMAVTSLPVQQRWAKVAAGLRRPPSLASAYLVQRGLFSPAETRALLGPERWAAAQTFDPVRQISIWAGPVTPGDAFAWVSRAELRAYTHHQLLRDTDVMSMAHSLEVRVPLLDHHLLEVILALPTSLKARPADRPKPLLARALGDLLPATVRGRRDKHGFTLPFDRWLRGPLASQVAAWTAATPDLLDPQAVQATHQRFQAGRLHWSRRWALAALQGWVARQ
ncbi:MAG: asparagine synthase (glutamine-hydrolyzing) [Oscillochloridaceae bacterium umkhey_bin13]